MITLQISENDCNQRLDVFVKKYLNQAPLSFIYRLFRKKDVKVNKKPAAIDYIVQLKDEVTIYITDQQLQDFHKRELAFSNRQDFEIIYEDENVLIVNKPIHLLVHPGENKNEDDLTRQVLNYLQKNNLFQLDKENTFVPALAHRIDRNTSGLVVFGKTHQALQELFAAFKKHEGVEKIYTALVCGKTQPEGEINAPLLKNEKTKIVTVDQQGLSAITKYKTIRNFADVSLVQLQILTGRTHQIRVHLHHIQHPLVGDQKYGNRQSDCLMKKYHMQNYFLHATKLTFHNFEKNLIYLNNKTFQAPFFAWQKDLLKQLGGKKDE